MVLIETLTANYFFGGTHEKAHQRYVLERLSDVSAMQPSKGTAVKVVLGLKNGWL